MAKNSSTGEPVNQAPGTSETTAEISTAATDTSETTAEIISTTPATTPAPATTNETPTPGTSNITAEIGTDTSEAPEEIISETPASTTTSEVPPPPATIPCNYLAGGYYRGEGNGRYPNPALVDQAEVIGKALAAGGVTPTAINRMIRTLKDAKKLPFIWQFRPCIRSVWRRCWDCKPPI